MEKELVREAVRARLEEGNPEADLWFLFLRALARVLSSLALLASPSELSETPSSTSASNSSSFDLGETTRREGTLSFLDLGELELRLNGVGESRFLFLSLFPSLHSTTIDPLSPSSYPNPLSPLLFRADPPSSPSSPSALALKALDARMASAPTNAAAASTTTPGGGAVSSTTPPTASSTPAPAVSAVSKPTPAAKGDEVAN